MFTVKQISLDGTQALFQTKEVRLWPKRIATTPGAPDEPQSVGFWSTDGAWVSLYEGTIFAMNEKGATVSRWDLGPSEVPQTVTDGASMTEAEVLNVAAYARGHRPGHY